MGVEGGGGGGGGHGICVHVIVCEIMCVNAPGVESTENVNLHLSLVYWAHGIHESC